MIALDWGEVFNRLWDATVSFGSMAWWRWALLVPCIVILWLCLRELADALKVDEAFDLTHPNWWNEEKKSIRQMMKKHEETKK